MSRLLILVMNRCGTPLKIPPRFEPPGESRAVGVPGRAGGRTGDTGPTDRGMSDCRIVLIDAADEDMAEYERSGAMGLIEADRGERCSWLSLLCAGDDVRDVGLSKNLDRSLASGLAVTL